MGMLADSVHDGLYNIFHAHTFRNDSAGGNGACFEQRERVAFLGALRELPEACKLSGLVLMPDGSAMHQIAVHTVSDTCELYRAVELRNHQRLDVLVGRHDCTHVRVLLRGFRCYHVGVILFRGIGAEGAFQQLPGNGSLGVLFVCGSEHSYVTFHAVLG